VTYPELAATLARAARLRVITDAQRDAVLARLALDFSRMQVIELRASMLDVVPRLVVRHPLRGYDAVQLASALHVQAAGSPVEFWSTDETLRAAALAEGLRVVAPR
jgi:predicted nucleic acid-binding protein